MAQRHKAVDIAAYGGQHQSFIWFVCQSNPFPDVRDGLSRLHDKDATGREKGAENLVNVCQTRPSAIGLGPLSTSALSENGTAPVDGESLTVATVRLNWQYRFNAPHDTTAR